MTDKNLFYNAKGKEIPDWLQGRGVGKAGEELTILDDDGEAKTVMPGEILVKCEKKGFSSVGIRFVETAVFEEYSKDMKRKLYFGHLPEEQQRKLMP